MWTKNIMVVFVTVLSLSLSLQWIFLKIPTYLPTYRSQMYKHGLSRHDEYMQKAIAA